MMTELALHARRHAHTLARRRHRRDVVLPRRRHQKSRLLFRYDDLTEDTILARVWKRQEERAADAADVNRAMARLKSKPTLMQRLRSVFRRTP